jgi:hypothetical protein
MTRTGFFTWAMAAACGVWIAGQAAAQQSAPARQGAPAARQARPAVSAEKSLKIKEFMGVGRRGLTKTPEYKSNVNRGAGQPKEWAKIAVPYETYAEWLDEVTFEFWVLSLVKEDGQNAYSLYKATVRYADVAEGGNHLCTMFLRPAAIERFGMVAAAAVEVSIGGTVVDEASESEIDVPEKWWRNPKVVESAQVKVREGYLLERSESPWALINIDDYEVIR